MITRVPEFLVAESKMNRLQKPKAQTRAKFIHAKTRSIHQWTLDEIMFSIFFSSFFLISNARNCWQYCCSVYSVVRRQTCSYPLHFAIIKEETMFIPCDTWMHYYFFVLFLCFVTILYSININVSAILCWVSVKRWSLQEITFEINQHTYICYNQHAHSTHPRK